MHAHATCNVCAGMYAFAALKLYQPKQLPKLKLLPLALAFVGYVVTQNVSLRLNTVGFYQISKISITPGVLVLEAVLFKRYPTTKELLSVVVVCLGVALATVTDTQVTTAQVPSLKQAIPKHSKSSIDSILRHEIPRSLGGQIADKEAT